MKKKLIFLSLSLFIFGLLSVHLFSEENIQYGHISFKNGEPKVIRLDGTIEDASVNLPIAPGDRIITGENDRCEIQFDNGTIMRLDRGTELKMETILAKSLTTRKKLTTLYLNKGQLYSIVNTYKLENFQVITPNAAVLMLNSSTNTVDVDTGKETQIYVERGKVRVMFGPKARNLKREVIKSKRGFRITADHRFVPDKQRNFEFKVWNESINKNFKKLHYGINKVPKPIYKYSPGIIHFAEKWSSLYGEWLYDELFGYVWRPYSDSFAYAHRPFYHAVYKNVNGRLILVPSQSWGWAPAHLGTWVWLGKRGWTWIPGTAFSTGYCGYSSIPWMSMAQFGQSYYWAANFLVDNRNYFPSFDYWIDEIYGGDDLYYLYRRKGKAEWMKAYLKKFNKVKKKLTFKNVPKGIKTIIKKMNKVPVSYLKQYLERPKFSTIHFRENKPLSKPLIKRSKSPSIKGDSAVTGDKMVNPVTLSLKPISTVLAKDNLKNFRNWSPDTRWSISRKIQIEYCSRTNQVRCLELGISSNNMSTMQRVGLRGDGVAFSSNGRRSHFSHSRNTSSGSSGSVSSHVISNVSSKAVSVNKEKE